MHFKAFPSGRPLRWAITFTCQIAFIFFGYDQGVMSGLITNEHLLDTLGHPNDAQLGFMLSIYNLGCFTGCILSWLIGDHTGRRNVIFISMAWIFVGASLQTSAYGLPHLMVGRFVTGIGTGLETSTIPVYQSELCEASRRGRLVCSEIVFVGLGLVIGNVHLLALVVSSKGVNKHAAAFFDYGVVRVNGPLGWRLPVGFQLFFAVIVTLMTLALPETPRFLYRKERNSEALQVLCDIYDTNAEDEKVINEQRGILNALQVESAAGEYSWAKLFKKDRVQTGKRVALAYGMQFMNQMGGINLVVYYMPTVLQRNVGLSHDMSVLLSATRINLMFLLGSLIPAFLADRIGRRTPMIVGSLGCGIAMMCISILLSFIDSPVSHATSIAGIAFFYMFMLIYGATVACVPWAYVPEILPLHVRSKGSALAVSSNWIWNFFVVMITPTLIGRLQWKAYLIFMCLNFAFVPIVYFCYPETANLSLEEVDLLYEQHGSSAITIARERQRKIREEKEAISETRMVEGLTVDHKAIAE
ncbi:unnamed protein product [Clonostachys rosea]|uniref:Major facilitator superfamily (MFS) profile domain-containing protein n=1 Tax=Bionectria ochroleuca TaxID=29856 RepID=A0ABY6UYL3_BIOOC|nr:unnamed protein product [Clonostachys rosea]